LADITKDGEDTINSEITDSEVSNKDTDSED